MLHFVVGTIMYGYNTVEHSVTGAIVWYILPILLSTLSELDLVSIIRSSFLIFNGNSCNLLSTTEPEPAHLQWSGQKSGLDYNLTDVPWHTSLPFRGVWGYIAT